MFCCKGRSESFSHYRMEDYIEQENLKAIKKQAEKEEIKKIENKKIADNLRAQMVELHEREKEARILKEEEERLNTHERLLQEAVS